MRGALPNKDLRIRMLRGMETLPGFDKLQEMPPQSGKAYNGIIRRARALRVAAAEQEILQVQYRRR